MLTNRFSFIFRHAEILFIKFDGQTMNGQLAVIHEHVKVVDGLVVIASQLVAALCVLANLEPYTVHEQYESDLKS